MDYVTIIIVIVGVSQGLFIGSALLLDKVYATVRNKYIGATLVLLSLQGALDIITFCNFDENNVWIEALLYFELESIIFVPYFLSFLSGVKKAYPIPKAVLLLPFLINLLYGILCATIAVLRKKEALWDTLYLDEAWVFIHYFNVLFVLLLHFSLLKLIRHTASNNKKGAFSIWISFSVLIALWVFFNALTHFFSSTEFYLLTFSVFWVTVTVFIFWFAFNGVVRQRLIQEQKSLHLILQNKLREEKSSVERSPANNGYYHLFIQLLEEQKVYRNPNLTRDNIAQKLGISPGYFSNMISESSSKSFNEIINAYRVQEVMDILSDGKLNHFSIAAIGLECGFKSKSAFYANFKKVTGLTPAEYKAKKSPEMSGPDE